jgi:hypothetical protein
LQPNFIFSQCPANLILNNTITSRTDFQEASNIIQASGVINSGAGADYRAGNYLILSSPFISKNGSAFRGYIAGCSGIIAVEQLGYVLEYC